MEDDVQKLTRGLEDAEQTVAAEEAPSVEPEKLEGGMRTYATDIAEMMRKEKGSIIKIALAEQKRRDEFKKKTDPTATKNIIVMMLGFILIVGGIMIFIYSIVNRSKPVPVVVTNSVLPSFFFTENQVQIDMSDLNKSELYRAIGVQTDNQTLVPGTINNLYISYQTSAGQAPVPSTVFLQKLGMEIPDSLFQSLYPGLMVGVYTKSPNNKLFMILKVKDFNDAFLAMRDWEKTMLSDTLRLFSITMGPDGKALFNKDFETVTLFNKEARVLNDSSGTTVLSYIFLDPKTIMVTTQTDAVEEVIKRMNLQTIK